MKINFFLLSILLSLHPVAMGQSTINFPTQGPLNNYYELNSNVALGQDGYALNYEVTGNTTISGNQNGPTYILSLDGSDQKFESPVFSYTGPDSVDPNEDPMLTFSYITINVSNVTNGTGNGGVISVNNQLLISYCTNTLFTNNSTHGMGGAIYSANSFYLEYGQNASFINNKALGQNGNGGAIAVGDSSSHADISQNGNIVFQGNHADQKGGAIYSESTSRYLYNQNISFINNSAGTAGGAIYVKGLVSFFANEGDVIFAGNTLADGTRQAIYQEDPSAFNQFIASEGTKISFYDGNYFAGTTTLHDKTPSGLIEFSGGSVTIPGLDKPIEGAGDKAVTHFNQTLILMNGVTKISHNARLKVGENIKSYTGAKIHFDLDGITQNSTPIITANSYVSGDSSKLTIMCTGGANTGWYNLIQFADPSGLGLDSFILEKTEESFYNWDPTTGMLSLQFHLGNEAKALVPTSLWTASYTMDGIFCNIMQRNCDSFMIPIDPEGHSHLWANYIGNNLILNNQGNILGVDSFTNGAILGYDITLSNKTSLGLAFAQTWGKNKYTPGGSADQNISTFALYGDVQLYKKSQHSLSLSFIAGYGYGDNKSKLSKLRGNWTNNNFAIQSQIIYQYEVDNKMSVLPYLGLQWQYLDSNNWTSNEQYHFEKTSMNFLRAQFGSYFLYKLNNKWSFCGNLSLDVDVERKNPTGSASLNGYGYALYCSNPGRVQFNADLGVNYTIDKHWSTYGGYGVSAAKRSTNQTFRVGAAYTF